MAKKIRLNQNDNKVKRLAGLFRINSDLLLLKDMVKQALGAKNTFLDYAGIIIIYRKCYNKADARGTCLKKEHRTGSTIKQEEIHEHFLTLGNKFVAHAEYEQYDPMYLDLVLDSDGKAIEIEPRQTLWEPIGE